MTKQRVDRLNSLLKEVISEVIRRDVDNPDVDEFISITRVDISKDLRHAKVYVSVMGSDEKKQKTIKALQSASGFIGINSSKKVVMRFFPALRFILDDTVDKVMRIEELLHEIKDEKNAREQSAQIDDDIS
jgi:ribosome-binding factor A